MEGLPIITKAAFSPQHHEAEPVRETVHEIGNSTYF
jgi:hypothetical protein